eukprot:4850469-Pyramimonas_sp.AAC.1
MRRRRRRRSRRRRRMAPYRYPSEAGFIGTFDFFYLPIDPDTSANRGYCFVNFVSPSAAWLFKMAYEGRAMSYFNSNKACRVPERFAGQGWLR